MLWAGCGHVSSARDRCEQVAQQWPVASTSSRQAPGLHGAAEDNRLHAGSVAASADGGAWLARQHACAGARSVRALSCLSARKDWRGRGRCCFVLMPWGLPAGARQRRRPTCGPRKARIGTCGVDGDVLGSSTTACLAFPRKRCANRGLLMLLEGAAATKQSSGGAGGGARVPLRMTC